MFWTRRERTPRVFAVLALIVVSVSAGAGATAASADPGTQSGPRPIAVSVPPEPTTVVLGGVSVVRVRVLNPGSAPVAVTVTGGALQFGDEGAVTVDAAPDADWKDAVDFPAGPLTVPADGYIDARLTVRVPAQLSPDLYFIGFLVTPLATGDGNVKVINQIGSFVTLDVPGPRDRELSASLDGPGFALSSHADETLRVRNVGHAAVRFWGENDTTSFPGGSRPKQQRIDTSLLPIGHERSFTLAGKPAWPIGLVTVKVRVTYAGRTEDATQEIVLQRRVLVVHPLALVALIVLVIAAPAWWTVRRRRRRRMLSVGSPHGPLGARASGAAFSRHPRT